MRRSRLAAARAGHVRKRGQPHGRQRNVGSPRGPHLMVSTSMVYGCIIDVFNTEDISAECSEKKHQGGPYVNSAGGVRFPDRSLNLIGNCVRPEPWLRPHHIRARQSRATKFASALKTCLRTVPGVRAPRAGMRLLSNAFRRGRHYFIARSADQNNAACPRTRWKATSFLPDQVSLPAHLQIRKLFSKKCLRSSRNIGYYLPR